MADTEISKKIYRVSLESNSSVEGRGENWLRLYWMEVDGGVRTERTIWHGTYTQLAERLVYAVTKTPPGQDDEVVLFVANEDGTVDCSWCGTRFNADDAIPDDNDDPICPKCEEAAREE